MVLVGLLVLTAHFEPSNCKVNRKSASKAKEESLYKILGVSKDANRCDTEKPLDSDHYQVVKYFRTGFSYYCNECNKPKPRKCDC